MSEDPPALTFGPPRKFMPVSHPSRRGGPIGYVEVALDYSGPCPIEPRIESDQAASEAAEKGAK